MCEISSVTLSPTSQIILSLSFFSAASASFSSENDNLKKF